MEHQSWFSPDGVATLVGVLGAAVTIYSIVKARAEAAQDKLDKAEREKHAAELASVKADLQREVSSIREDFNCDVADLKTSCKTNWDKLDEMRKELALCIKREEHDRMRQEIKADLKAMEDRITETFRDTVRQLVDRGGHS